MEIKSFNQYFNFEDVRDELDYPMIYSISQLLHNAKDEKCKKEIMDYFNKKYFDEFLSRNHINSYYYFNDVRFSFKTVNGKNLDGCKILYNSVLKNILVNTLGPNAVVNNFTSLSEEEAFNNYIEQLDSFISSVDYILAKDENNVFGILNRLLNDSQFTNFILAKYENAKKSNSSLEIKDFLTYLIAEARRNKRLVEGIKENLSIPIDEEYLIERLDMDKFMINKYYILLKNIDGFANEDKYMYLKEVERFIKDLSNLSSKEKSVKYKIFNGDSKNTFLSYNDLIKQFNELLKNRPKLAELLEGKKDGLENSSSSNSIIVNLLNEDILKNYRVLYNFEQIADLMRDNGSSISNYFYKNVFNKVLGEISLNVGFPPDLYYYFELDDDKNVHMKWNEFSFMGQIFYYLFRENIELEEVSEDSFKEYVIDRCKEYRDMIVRCTSNLCKMEDKQLLLDRYKIHTYESKKENGFISFEEFLQLFYDCVCSLIENYDNYMEVIKRTYNEQVFVEHLDFEKFKFYSYSTLLGNLADKLNDEIIDENLFTHITVYVKEELEKSRDDLASRYYDYEKNKYRYYTKNNFLKEYSILAKQYMELLSKKGILADKVSDSKIDEVKIDEVSRDDSKTKKVSRKAISSISDIYSLVLIVNDNGEVKLRVGDLNKHSLNNEFREYIKREYLNNLLSKIPEVSDCLIDDLELNVSLDVNDVLLINISFESLLKMLSKVIGIEFKYDDYNNYDELNSKFEDSILEYGELVSDAIDGHENSTVYANYLEYRNMLINSHGFCNVNYQEYLNMILEYTINITSSLDEMKDIIGKKVNYSDIDSRINGKTYYLEIASKMFDEYVGFIDSKKDVKKEPYLFLAKYLDEIRLSGEDVTYDNLNSKKLLESYDSFVERKSLYDLNKSVLYSTFTDSDNVAKLISTIKIIPKSEVDKFREKQKKKTGRSDVIKPTFSEKYATVLSRKHFLDNTDYIYSIVGQGTFAGNTGYVYPSGVVIFEKFFTDESERTPQLGNATYAMRLDNFVRFCKESRADLTLYKNSGGTGFEKIPHRGDYWKKKILNVINGIEYTLEAEEVVDELIKTGKMKRENKGKKHE